MFTFLFCMILSFASADMDAGVGEPPLLEQSEIGSVEDRTYGLAKILRCPVCQGLSVADSRSDAAVAMKDRIKELVAMGYSDEQIIDYFVGRYGEFTLLKPKYEHWFVWVAPGILGFLGVIVVGIRLRGDSDQEVPMEEPTQQDENELSKYRAQILSELEEE
jgi:cytochrome c-type biogenesis protein CcmH/NrfF